MSDISLHFTWFDWLLAALVFGWPGLILGGALGALLFSKRRVLYAVLGALAGCALWAVAAFLPKLL